MSENYAADFEFELPAEILLAGTMALARSDPRVQSDDEIVSDVFFAMLSALGHLRGDLKRSIVVSFLLGEPGGFTDKKQT
jgi:hypothetical protein